MPRPTHDAFLPLAFTWLALLALSLISLGMGEWFRHNHWLPVLVASIIWLKGFAVARWFIEAHRAPRWIASAVFGFITLVPALLLATTYFHQPLLRLLSL